MDIWRTQRGGGDKRLAEMFAVFTLTFDLISRLRVLLAEVMRENHEVVLGTFFVNPLVYFPKDESAAAMDAPALDPLPKGFAYATCI